MSRDLVKRIALLEKERSKADIGRMTDGELDAHIRTLVSGSSDFYDAVLARVARHPSAFPVVVDDPERPWTRNSGD